MRLIDADALLSRLYDYAITYEDQKFCEKVEFAINKEPTIELKRGRWEVVDYEEPRRYGCSECKRLVWHTENYCPNCGARMEEADEID